MTKRNEIRYNREMIVLFMKIVFFSKKNKKTSLLFNSCIIHVVTFVNIFTVITCRLISNRDVLD